MNKAPELFIPSRSPAKGANPPPVSPTRQPTSLRPTRLVVRWHKLGHEFMVWGSKNASSVPARRRAPRLGAWRGPSWLFMPTVGPLRICLLASALSAIKASSRILPPWPP